MSIIFKSTSSIIVKAYYFIFDLVLLYVISVLLNKISDNKLISNSDDIFVISLLSLVTVMFIIETLKAFSQRIILENRNILYKDLFREKILKVDDFINTSQSYSLMPKCSHRLNFAHDSITILCDRGTLREIVSAIRHEQYGSDFVTNIH